MPHAMQVRMPRLAVILAALLPIAACNRAPEPVAAVSPGANAPMNAASAELDGITLQARLIDGDEDHPQARFAPLIAAMGAPRPWTEAAPPAPQQNEHYDFPRDDAQS